MKADSDRYRITKMLIPREVLDFPFRSSFDLARESDREFLGWVLDQFLYGEVTGIQCGYWLYRAPSLQAAAFLARQATEELSHVKRILQIQDLLGVKPRDAHRAVKFLSTGMMGATWGEHVCLEMAIGEGLVLSVFYALARLVPDERIRKILESAIQDEERHVEFGERETAEWLRKYPGDRKTLLSQAAVQLFALRRLRNFALKRIPRGHAVSAEFAAFYDHVVAQFEERIRLLGLFGGAGARSLSRLSGFAKASLVFGSFFRARAMRLRRRHTPLTRTYLEDPWVAGARGASSSRE